LEGEPSPQSEILSTQEQVFIKHLSILCSVHLSLNPDLTPSPCRWKTSPQHNAATTMPGWCQVSSRRDTWHSGQIVQSWFHQTR
jgi:hypothetical protein